MTTSRPPLTPTERERYATAGTAIATADTAIGPHHRARAGQYVATLPAALPRAASAMTTTNGVGAVKIALLRPNVTPNEAHQLRCQCDSR